MTPCTAWDRQTTKSSIPTIIYRLIRRSFRRTPATRLWHVVVSIRRELRCLHLADTWGRYIWPLRLYSGGERRSSRSSRTAPQWRNYSLAGSWRVLQLCSISEQVWRNISLYRRSRYRIINKNPSWASATSSTEKPSAAGFKHLPPADNGCTSRCQKNVHDINSDIVLVMAASCYVHVRQCPERARERNILRRSTAALQLFPPTAPLEAVAIDLLGPLPATKSGIIHLLKLR